MKSSTFLLVLLSLGCVSLLFILLNTSPSTTSSTTTTTQYTLEQQHLQDLQQLMDIISKQNETLYLLKKKFYQQQQQGVGQEQDVVVVEEGQDVDKKQLYNKIKKQDNEIIKLQQELHFVNNEMELLKNKQLVTTNNMMIRTIEVPVESSEDNNFLKVQQSAMDEYCETRFGLELINKWRNSKEIWCENEPDSKIETSLECYPYKQQHKSDKDMFCIATNFIIDFSKISGKHGTSKPQRGNQYLNFGKGSTLSSCRKTSKYNSRLFMPHNSRQVSELLLIK